MNWVMILSLTEKYKGNGEDLKWQTRYRLGDESVPWTKSPQDI